MARWLIILGLLIAALGLVLQFAPGLLSWFGRLPGDIRIEGEKGTVWIPITSMLIVSLVLSVILNLFHR